MHTLLLPAAYTVMKQLLMREDGTRMNQNELLRRLAAQAGGDAALERLSGALGTADGRRAVEQLSAQHAAELEQAAKAAQRGDMRSAAQAAQKLMQTPEGARLAAQLRHIYGK